MDESVHRLEYSLCAPRTEGNTYASIPGRESEVELLGLAFQVLLNPAGTHVFGTSPHSSTRRASPSSRSSPQTRSSRWARDSAKHLGFAVTSLPANI